MAFVCWPQITALVFFSKSVCRPSRETSVAVLVFEASTFDGTASPFTVAVIFSEGCRETVPPVLKYINSLYFD